MAGALKQQLGTILVDDSLWVVNLVVQTPEVVNFLVHPARSGLDALRLATDYAGTIDILLSDMKMPGTHSLQNARSAVEVSGLTQAGSNSPRPVGCPITPPRVCNFNDPRMMSLRSARAPSEVQMTSPVGC